MDIPVGYIQQMAQLGLPIGSAGTPKQVTASRELNAQDNGATLCSTSGSAFTLTIPAGLPSNFGCVIVQMGAGALTVDDGAGVTLNNVSGAFATSAQYAVAALISVAAESYIISGDLA